MKTKKNEKMHATKALNVMQPINVQRTICLFQYELNSFILKRGFEDYFFTK